MDETIKTPLCDRCELIPDGLPEIGSIYISPAIMATGEKLQKAFEKSGYPLESDQGILHSTLPSATLIEILRDYKQQFSEAELESARALVLPEGKKPEMRDLIHMENLLSIFTLADATWLTEILRNKKITSHYHAIRSAAEPERIYGRESLLRGIADDGSIVPAGQLFDVARKADLLFFLDREARLSAVRNAADRGWNEKLFINFNPTSIYSPENCLSSTFAAIAVTDLKPEDIVFEIVESDKNADLNRMLSIIKVYREHGFLIALDDLGAGYSSLNLLHKLKPDIVKLDMELIQNVSGDRFKQSITRSILDLSNELDICSVAEGVETELDYEWVKSNGATYVQGFYFDKPSA